MSIEPTMSSTYACEVAFVNKQRFNEAVARGDYPCAPAVEGRARVFAARDVIGLWLYGQLTEEGLSPAKAGELACQLVAVLRDRPDLEEVALVRDTFRRRWVVPTDEIEQLIHGPLCHTRPVGIERLDLRTVRGNVDHQFDKIARTFVHPDDRAEED